jgi:serine/threonine-protein kinase HipA
LDIAHAILVNGTNGLIKRDLAQLFRRAVFNALISNRDDHLRNHGFILTQSGWRLSPAFDLNPTIDKAEHVLSLDFNENRLGFECVMATAEYYDLSLDQAVGIQAEVLQSVRQWEVIAKTLRIPRAEIELMRPAFTTQAKLA